MKTLLLLVGAVLALATPNGAAAQGSVLYTTTAAEALSEAKLWIELGVFRDHEGSLVRQKLGYQGCTGTLAYVDRSGEESVGTFDLGDIASVELEDDPGKYKTVTLVRHRAPGAPREQAAMFLWTFENRNGAPMKESTVSSWAQYAAEYLREAVHHCSAAQ